MSHEGMSEKGTNCMRERTLYIFKLKALALVEMARSLKERREFDDFKGKREANVEGRM